MDSLLSYLLDRDEGRCKIQVSLRTFSMLSSNSILSCMLPLYLRIMSKDKQALTIVMPVSSVVTQDAIVAGRPGFNSQTSQVGNRVANG